MAKFGDWGRLSDLMRGFDRRLAKHCRTALLRAGAVLEGMIKDRLLSGRGMTKLHGFTVAMKGSSKPLIDDGDLLGSVHSRTVAPDAVFVGVHQKDADGTDIAALHEREEGTRIRVTPRMRAYLHAHGLHLKASTTEIFIPGRPFVRPSMRDFKAQGHMERLFREAVRKSLQGSQS